MSKKYKVSIIIPVYNGIKYLNECMDSVINQTLEDIEIICVDDGSTDGTSELLDKYKLQDFRIKVIHKTNSGYGHSMNIGIDNASGDYIGIVESDDYIDRRMYEELYNYAVKHDAEIVKADSYTFYGEGKNRKFIYTPLYCKADEEWYNQELNYQKSYKIFDAYMTSWSGIYKRSFLMNNKIRHNETPGASYQDNGFWIQNMIYGNKIFFLQRPFYYLRRDNESSSVFNRNKVYCVCEEYKFMRQCILKRNVDCEKLLSFLWNRQFSVYKNELLRIAYKYKKNFIYRFAQDFEFAIKNGELKKEDVMAAQWDNIQELISNPDGYFDKYYKIGTTAMERLKKSNFIAVYGAKGHAVQIVGDIQTAGYGKKLLGVVVTDLFNNPESVRYVLVYSLDDIKYPNDTLFIIAAQEKYQQDIVCNLSKKRYTNIMMYQEMRQ